MPADVLDRLKLPLRRMSVGKTHIDGAGHGLLLRAYDHACFVSESGRIEATFDVPPSTLEEGVGLEQVQGAMVFERGGCHAYVVGRSDLGHGRHLHGIESHIYSDLSQPHDTVCFGFRVRPLGELRVGTRPEVNEAEPNNDVPEAQRIQLGTVVNGVISSPTDVDYTVFAGTAEPLVATVLAALAILAGAATTVSVTITGHNGAKSVWESDK